MKSVLLLFLFLHLPAADITSDEQEIRAMLDVYWKHNVALDMDGIMDHMYPGLFEVYPKPMLKRALEQAFNEPTLEFGFGEMEVHDVSDVLEVEGVKYALVDYGFDMYVRPVPEEGQDEVDPALLEMMQAGFNDKYGEEKVSLNENGRFTINADGKLYAIRSPEYDGWKVLEKKDQYKELMKQWFPKKVLKKLK